MWAGKKIGGVILLFQVLISGLALGCIYALVAMGYNLTFWTLKIINFAQGDLLMIVVMLSLSFGILWFKLPMVLAVIIALIIAALFGVLLQKVAISPLLKNPSSSGWIVSTMGAGIVLQSIAVMLWGTIEMAFPYFLGKQVTIKIGSATLDMQWLIIMGITLAIVLLFEIFVNNTIFGKAIKATAADKFAARAMGINTDKIVIFSVASSSVLAGIAGVLIAPILSANPYMGSMIGIKGFAAAVLGGMGSTKGALIGGIIIGISELLASGFINPALKDAVSLLILFSVLVFLPNGIFGQQYYEKV